VFTNTTNSGRPGSASTPKWTWALALVLVLLPLLYWEFCPDDFYIYLTYARNLAQNGELAFNPGQRSYGFTSPLWLAVLGVCHLTSLPILLGKLICWLLFVLALWRFHLLLKRRFGDATIAWAGVVLLAANPWTLRWALAGLETSAALLATVLAFELFLGRHRGAGLAVGLLPLLRPEFLVWTLAFSMYSLTRRRWRQALIAWIPAALWHGFSVIYFGHVFPNTAYAKSSGWAWSTALSAAAKIVQSLPPLETLAAGAAFLLLLLRPRQREKTWAAIVPLTPLVLLLALYVVRGVNVHTRYMVPIFPFTAFLLVLLLEKRKKLLIGAVSAAMAIGAVQSLVWIYPATRTYSQSENKVNIAIGKHLHHISAPGDTVFLWDIGAIGYFARRPVVDLNGIIDRRVSKRQDDFRQIISRHMRRFPRRAYLVDIHPERLNFLQRPAAGVRARFLYSLPFEKMFIMQGAPLFYSLYELFPDSAPETED
jgi:hypothetical protein